MTPADLQRRDGKPKDMETLLGGTEIEVTFLDKTTERVRVRQLHVADYPAYQRALDNEADTCEVLCDRKPGWGRTLDFESVFKIVDEGERLNAGFFLRWLQRKVERNGRILGGAAPLPSSSPNAPSPSA